MDVYIVMQEPYHDFCAILGVYSTLDAAMRAWPSPNGYIHNGWYCTNREDVVAEQTEHVENTDDLLIYRKRVQDG